MAATRTLVVEARKSFLELLATRPNMDGKQVEYGWPGVDKREKELVYTGPRASIDHEPAALMAGRLARKETAGFDIVIVTEAKGGTQLDADELALELGGDVEAVFAENRTLGVVGINWATVGPVSLKAFMSDESYFAELTYEARYSARLV